MPRYIWQGSVHSCRLTVCCTYKGSQHVSAYKSVKSKHLNYRPLWIHQQAQPRPRFTSLFLSDSLDSFLVGKISLSEAGQVDAGILAVSTDRQVREKTLQTPVFLAQSTTKNSIRAVKPHLKRDSVCFNTFTNSSPVLIAQLLSVYSPSRHLRSSSDTRTLRIPSIKTKSFGQIAFSFTGPAQ